jgi:hypothetical protein
MKIYFLYIIASLLTAWVILVLLGVSAGFANLTPIIAIIGSLLLFAIATPLLLYNTRIGLILGLLFLIAMLPFTIGFAKSGLEDRIFNWGVILSFLPVLLTLLALYLSVKQIFFQPAINLYLPVSATAKFVLAAIPIVITLLYFVFYGREWL